MQMKRIEFKLTSGQRISIPVDSVVLIEDLDAMCECLLVILGEAASEEEVNVRHLDCSYAKAVHRLKEVDA
jgi:hypothetical protein